MMLNVGNVKKHSNFMGAEKKKVLYNVLCIQSLFLNILCELSSFSI